MDARHLTTADMVYTQQFLIRSIFCPRLFTVNILYDFIGQRNGCAAGVIELVHVVRLLHLYIVLWKLIHDFSKITVYG